MKFIDKFIRTVEVALHKRRSDRDDGDFLRQNSPPDDREAEIVEANSAEADLVMASHSAAGDSESGAESNNRKTRATRAGGNS